MKKRILKADGNKSKDEQLIDVLLEIANALLEIGDAIKALKK